MDDLLFGTSKVLQSLLLPPTSLVLIALACLPLARRRRWARWVAAAALALLAVLATPALSLWMLNLVEARATPLELPRLRALPSRETVIVVLGGGLRSWAPEYPEGEALDGGSLARCRYAARLSRSAGLRIAVTGAGPDGASHSEAELMRSFIERELGRDVFVVEPHSRNTWQNAEFSAARLRPLGVRRVVLVTDAFHMRRAVRAFAHQGFEVVPAPTGFHRTRAPSALEFLPAASGLWQTSVAIRELLGDLVYALRGAGP